MAFNNEDILVLAKAGFTAQQIAALNMVGSQPAPVQLPDGSGVMVGNLPPAPAAPTQPAAPAAPTQPAAPAAPTQPAAPPTVAPHSVDDVLAAINGLTSTIQTANLMSAQMPTEQKTAETVLASIINPPKKEV